MAIDGRNRLNELLDASLRPIAAGAALGWASLVIIGASLVLVLSEKMPGAVATYLGILIITQAFVIVSGLLMMMRGHTAAQQFLLVYHLFLGGFAVLVGAFALLSGVPEWYTALYDTKVLVPKHFALIVAPAAGIYVGLAVLLMYASAAGTRVRYASVVAVTVAAALCLAVVLNLIVQIDAPRPIDMETRAQYGAAPRILRILDGIDQEVVITCVYAPQKNASGELAEKYGPQTLELLQDIADRHEKVKVVDASSDNAKARVVMRLAGRMGGRYDAHINFLDQFIKRGKLMDGRLDEKGKMFAALDGSSYLDNWGLPSFLPDRFDTQRRSLATTLTSVQREMRSSSLPDYPGMVERANRALTELQAMVLEMNARLAALEELSSQVAKGRDGALEQAAGAVRSAQAMAVAIGSDQDPPPTDPSAMLGRYLTAVRETRRHANQTIQVIRNMTSDETVYLLISAAPMFRTMTQEIDGKKIQRRRNILELYSSYARMIQQEETDAENILANFTKDRQIKMILDRRQGVGDLAVSFSHLEEMLRESLASLTTLVPQSSRMMAAAKKGQLLPKLTEYVTELLAAANSLPQVKGAALPVDFQKDNIVIVEIGDKVEIIEFEEVWPVRFAPMQQGPSPKEAARSFNGNAAVGSRLLTMTREPFAQVLLTYSAPPGPANPYSPTSTMPPDQLTELTRRLEEANFKVDQWDLSKPRPVPGPDDPKMQVLIILPPVPGRRGMAPVNSKHMAKIRDAIDNGTGAIFMAHFMGQSEFGQSPFPFNNYLTRHWGINVRADLFIMPAVAIPEEQGRYKVNLNRLRHLPLSGFSDHAISAPLQGRQTVWSLMAVLEATDKRKSNVKVQPLLTVPQDPATWATADMRSLAANWEQQESTVWPDYEKGDVRSPFTLAMAATRTAPSASGPTTATSAPASRPGGDAARIVVLGLGVGLVDSYLTEAVPHTDARNVTTLGDRPAANADIVINSCYWLIGKETYITAGPTRLPIVVVGNVTRKILAGILIGVVPMLVLAVGVGIMAMRKW